MRSPATIMPNITSKFIGAAFVLGLIALCFDVSARAQSADGSEAPKKYFMFMDLKEGEGQSQRGSPDYNKYKVVPIKDGIYMIEAMVGNMAFSVGEDGAFLIDSGFSSMTDTMIKTIAEYTDKPIEMLFNTHWHGDHVGSNITLGGRGVLILSQDDVMQWLTTPQISGMSAAPKKPFPPAGLPKITFSDEMTIRFNGQTIKARKVPAAHTAGDAYIHFVEANVFVLGDIYTTGTYPWIDLNTGGDINGLVQALDDVIDEANPDSVIVPGHMRLSNYAELVDYRDMVATMRDRIQAAINDGKSLEEILASKPLADLDEKWGNSLVSTEVITLVVHDSLLGKGTKTAYETVGGE